eukprot:TRINITY_DN2062_c0_g1_i1.p2 TRINITY_DN2062_c0_g1~~TRINITY_DN2062_c0_g1_i1.p2  ORF type:complete len:253 (-),score=25.20 TRINITY_DN2062_c0_g1_i1:289-948(-)
MAARTLYWGSGSPFAWRALLALEEKALEYESKQITFSAGEHKAQEYLALNPRGQVPTFVEGDVVICESMAIVTYLDSAYPEPALLPKDNQAKAKALQRFFEASVSQQKLQDALGMKFRGLIKTEADEERFQANLLAAKEDLKFWEGYLAKSTYAAGDEFTIADTVFIPLVLMCQRIGATFAEFPNIKRYVDLVKERPSVQKTWPPHWKESEGPTFGSVM